MLAMGFRLGELYSCISIYLTFTIYQLLVEISCLVGFKSGEFAFLFLHLSVTVDFVGLRPNALFRTKTVTYVNGTYKQK